MSDSELIAKLVEACKALVEATADGDIAGRGAQIKYDLLPDIRAALAAAAEHKAGPLVSYLRSEANAAQATMTCQRAALERIAKPQTMRKGRYKVCILCHMHDGHAPDCPTRIAHDALHGYNDAK